MSEILLGKVAKIISWNSIVINIGSDQGVEEGSTCKIIKEVPVENPDNTKEMLGSVSITKAEFIITSVSSKLSFAVTKKVYSYVHPSDKGAINTNFSNVFLKEEDMKISIGDIVVIKKKIDPLDDLPF